MYLENIQAISFDLDDTLWPFFPAVERAEAQLYSWLLEHAPKTTTVLPGAEVLRTFREEFQQLRPDLSSDYRSLRLGSIRLALQRAGENMELAEAAYEVFHAGRHKVDFFEDVAPALTWLKSRFPLVAVTNGTADLRLTGGEEFFQTTLSAMTFGAAKPDPAIFIEAARLTNVRPAQMLHVGDDFELDVAGALAAGMRAAWLVRHRNFQTKTVGQTLPDRCFTISSLTMLCQVLGGPTNRKS
ncbi:HAD-IA family hydrolase [Paraburkholderia sp. Tr-20389]|uniref:HAD family hydrolase n=1 Tax=Paraburkholderia sp. Tr-20389 TaxID=2703903 RepID=UPI00197D1DC2|nr:HAD-IA family hydrolase [Paraburkholderia sp. Tr-20389]MBN3754351.1 HAD-IA family hydrolase [Paraburkholderia sp. Tr-20389]